MTPAISASDPIRQFFDERQTDIEAMGRDEALRRKPLDWMLHAGKYKHTCNFTWMGRPIIKFPWAGVPAQKIRARD